MYVASDVSSRGPSTVPINRALSLPRTLYKHTLSFNMPTEKKANFT